MRVANAGMVGGEDDVAEQADSGAKTNRVAVHFADDDLLAVENAEHDFLRFHDGAVEDFGIIVHLAHAGDIAAGAERLAGTGQDDDVDGMVHAEIGENARGFLVHFGGHGVQRLRPVERHRHDAAGLFEFDVLIAGIIDHFQLPEAVGGIRPAA